MLSFENSPSTVVAPHALDSPLPHSSSHHSSGIQDHHSSPIQAISAEAEEPPSPLGTVVGFPNSEPGSPRGSSWGLVRSRGIPLRVIFVAVLCVFAVGPAVTLWMISWRTGQDALSGVQGLAMSSVEGVSVELQDSLMTSVVSSLESFVDRSEAVVEVLMTSLQASGVLAEDGSTVGDTFEVVGKYSETVFSIVKITPWIFFLTVSLLSDIRNGTGMLEAVYYARFNVNFLTQQIGPTLYTLPLRVNSFGNETVSRYCLANATTGAEVFCFTEFVGTPRQPLDVMNVPYYHYQPTCDWNNKVSFLPYIGIPDTRLLCWIPSFDFRAEFFLDLSVNVYTISSLLLSLAPAPGDRLFLIFRTEEGTLVGASHGKFFSHSDIDFDKNNPFSNPPPIDSFQVYSAVNSTDATIRATALWLLEKYGHWTGIPEFNTSLGLSTGAFWIRSQYITSRHNLKWQVFLLMDTDTRMGPVLEKNDQAQSDIRRTNVTLVAILVGVIFAALGIAVGIAVLLSLPLERLAKGMGLLAVLELQGDALSVATRPSVISEVRGCQQSFDAMERGLEAFAKYVPRDVVKMMLSGAMGRSSIMAWKTV
eukprot:RCo016229